MSPSCMPNVSRIIAGINKSKLNVSQTPQTEASCKCTEVICPLGGECEISEIVYKATITNVPDTKVYFGLTSRKFIERYRLHKSSMKLRDSKHHTTLSKEVWRLRDLGYSPSVTFTIHKRAKAAQAAATRCDLCITEKFSIITCTEPGLLNSNDELFSKCKHKAKWKISKVI